MKPRLLLHACCGVCSSYVPEKLMPDFDVTVYFENSNLFPEDEFFKRRGAAQIMAQKYKLPFLTAEYAINDWFKAVRGMVKEMEGGKRCQTCIGFRLNKTMQFAKEKGFEWVATTLSVSRRKNVDQINQIGHDLAKVHGLKFLGKDWKKENGELISQQRAKEAGIYRQNYCGCVFSLFNELRQERLRPPNDKSI
ncbi:MAG: epoxyqueuosine reductase QueH [Patescibacteria group bacterium]|nr:epoxyqueuosine reductase QueH [Patescibacteria group bacterium]